MFYDRLILKGNLPSTWEIVFWGLLTTLSMLAGYLNVVLGIVTAPLNIVLIIGLIALGVLMSLLVLKRYPWQRYMTSTDVVSQLKSLARDHIKAGKKRAELSFPNLDHFFIHEPEMLAQVMLKLVEERASYIVRNFSMEVKHDMVDTAMPGTHESPWKMAVDQVCNQENIEMLEILICYPIPKKKMVLLENVLLKVSLFKQKNAENLLTRLLRDYEDISDKTLCEAVHNCLAASRS